MADQGQGTTLNPTRGPSLSTRNTTSSPVLTDERTQRVAYFPRYTKPQGVLTGSGVRLLRMSFVLVGTGTVTKLANTRGQANLGVTSLLRADGQRRRPGTLAIRTTFRLTATAVTPTVGQVQPAAAHASMTGTALDSPIVVADATTVLHASVTLHAGPAKRTAVGVAPLKASARFGYAAGTTRRVARAALSSTVRLAGTGENINYQIAEARLKASVTLHAGAQLVRVAKAPLQATVKLRGQPVGQPNGSAALRVRTRLVGGYIGEAHLLAPVRLTANAQATYRRQAELHVRARFINISGRLAREAQADFKSRFRMLVWFVEDGSLALRSTFTLRADGVVRPAPNRLRLTASLTASGVRVQPGQAALRMSHVLVARPSVTAFGHVDLLAIARLVAARPNLITSGHVDLLTVATLTGTATVRTPEPEPQIFGDVPEPLPTITGTQHGGRVFFRRL